MSRSVLAELLSDQGLDIDDDIRELKGVRDYVVESCLCYIQDSELPLDQRWDIFTQIHEFLPSSDWHISFESLGTDWSWYDNMYVDRYQTVTLVELADRVRYRHDCNEWDHINLDDLKEEILATGFGRFINNW